MDEYGEEIRYRTKDDDSPVTAADLGSNDAVKSVLAPTQIPILSEEDVDTGARVGAQYVWVVDPLDGTADFVERTGEFTVMVALVSGGVPVLGVIHQPAAGVTYAAQRGGGAWRDEGSGWVRIGVDRAPLPDCIGVRSRHHFTAEEGRFVKSLGLGDIRPLGSSLKVVRICEGTAHVYVTFTDRMKEWDTAASHCIIHEAGGRMTDVTGKPLVYNRPDIFHRAGILATNGTVHDYIAHRYATAGPWSSESRAPGRR